ncbi:L-glyceraldehyde 3-phosphate reductase, partial [Nonomuraea turkmeniaca]
MKYQRQPYRRCGRSGLLLPAVSLGLWHNFGEGKPVESQRAILHKAL